MKKVKGKFFSTVAKIWFITDDNQKYDLYFDDYKKISELVPLIKDDGIILKQSEILHWKQCNSNSKCYEWVTINNIVANVLEADIDVFWSSNRQGNGVVDDFQIMPIN